MERPYIDTEFRVLNEKGEPVTEFSKGPKKSSTFRTHRPKLYFNSYGEALEDYQASRQSYLDAEARGEHPLYRPTPPSPGNFSRHTTEADIAAYKAVREQYEQDTLAEYHKSLEKYNEAVARGESPLYKPEPPRRTVRF